MTMDRRSEPFTALSSGDSSATGGQWKRFREKLNIRTSRVVQNNKKTKQLRKGSGESKIKIKNSGGGVDLSDGCPKPHRTAAKRSSSGCCTQKTVKCRSDSISSRNVLAGKHQKKIIVTKRNSTGGVVSSVPSSVEDVCSFENVPGMSSRNLLGTFERRSSFATFGSNGGGGQGGDRRFSTGEGLDFTDHDGGPPGSMSEPEEGGGAATMKGWRKDLELAMGPLTPANTPNGDPLVERCHPIQRRGFGMGSRRRKTFKVDHHDVATERYCSLSDGSVDGPPPQVGDDDVAAPLARQPRRRSSHGLCGRGDRRPSCLLPHAAGGGGGAAPEYVSAVVCDFDCGVDPRNHYQARDAFLRRQSSDSEGFGSTTTFLKGRPVVGGGDHRLPEVTPVVSSAATTVSDCVAESVDLPSVRIVAERRYQSSGPSEKQQQQHRQAHQLQQQHRQHPFERGVPRPLSFPRFARWASSFYRSDPRYEIVTYFNDVAQNWAGTMATAGSTRFRSTVSRHGARLRDVLPPHLRSQVFTVWRPTSTDAIRKMMTGEGVGKGLDIKGKSARCGVLSGYVPFLQIHEENHKKALRTLPKDARIRVFYKTKIGRDQAGRTLESISIEMCIAVLKAKAVLENQKLDDEIWENALKTLMWDMSDPSVADVDDYAANGCYGLEVAERLFWEAYVMRQDCTRVPGSKYDTGRMSEPAFQDMNLRAIQKSREDRTNVDGPRAVVWQASDDADESPMCPLSLLMAYEENGRVAPVVSDFDCFVMGTKGVSYERPLPPEQVDMVRWCVDQIERILDSPHSRRSWTSRWLDVLKENGGLFDTQMPRFGFGDPKSYHIMECAIRRLRSNGAVRHGAECFNYAFPQELDDHFLVVSDTLPGKVPWKYVQLSELQDILCQKIDEGFTFPLNPKWILCDPGWKKVYDRLKSSRCRHVQRSVDAWFPPDSGLREKFESIHRRHPHGFTRLKRSNGATPSSHHHHHHHLAQQQHHPHQKMPAAGHAPRPLSAAAAAPPTSALSDHFEAVEGEDGGGGRRPSKRRNAVVDDVDSHFENGSTAPMDMAEMELERYLTFRRARSKLKAFLFWMRIYEQSRQRVAEREAKEKHQQRQSRTSGKRRGSDESGHHHPMRRGRMTEAVPVDNIDGTAAADRRTRSGRPRRGQQAGNVANVGSFEKNVTHRKRGP